MLRILLLVIVAIVVAISGFWVMIPKNLPQAPTEPQDNYVIQQAGTWKIEDSGNPHREESFELLLGEQHGWWILRATRNAKDDTGELKILLRPDFRPVSMEISIEPFVGPSFKSQALIKGNTGEITSKAAFLPIIKRTFELSHPAILADPTFYSSFLVVLALIESQNLEQGMFSGVVPSRLASWDMNISNVGPQTILAEDESLNLAHHSISFGEIHADLFSRNGELVGLNVAPNRIAYRSDLYPTGLSLEETSTAAKLSPPDSVREEEIKFTSADGTQLAGSITFPSLGNEPYSAVLMIGGGPSDRNENFPGFATDTFNRIAWYLAENGIASLRYDKRGAGESDGDPQTGFFSQQIDDAQAALETLYNHPRIHMQQVFVLGHSEGALLGARLTSQMSTAGLIAMTSPVGRKFEWNWLWQTELELDVLNLSRKEVDVEIEKWEQLFAFIKQSSGEWDNYELSQMQHQFPKIDESYYQSVSQQSLTWWREILLHDPLGTMKMIDSPVLILQGDKDISVPFDEGELITEAMQDAGNSNVKFELVPNLNHFLRHHPEPADAINSFRHLSKPLDQRVLEAILNWVNSQKES
jgi:hypothetical protein